MGLYDDTRFPSLTPPTGITYFNTNFSLRKQYRTLPWVLLFMKCKSGMARAIMGMALGYGESLWLGTSPNRTKSLDDALQKPDSSWGGRAGR